LSSSRSKLSNAMKSSYVKTVVLIAVIIGGVVAFWFGLRAVLGTEYPLLTVASGSMEPTLFRGDLILVQGISNFSDVKADLQPYGDIIIFHRPSQYGAESLIVHRAVQKYQGADGLWYFRTQGDAAPPQGVLHPDPWTVPQTLVVGKLVGKVPWVGYIPLYIREPLGIMLIVVLFFIIILAEYLPVLFKKQKEQR